MVASSREVSKLHWHFLQFTNKAWFGHLTNAEYGNLIWEKWREVMETQRLYEEVKVQLAELDEFLEEKQQEHQEKLVRFLTYIGFPIGMAIGLLSANIDGLKVSLMTAVAVLSGVASVSILIWVIASQITQLSRRCLPIYSKFKNRGKR